MANTGFTVFLCIIAIECFFISAGNIFTIFVFWKNRKKLKRTSFLLINLAVADLLVGVATEITFLEFNFNSQQLKEHGIDNSAVRRSIFAALQSVFSSSSVYFLALISLERAYALIWPFRHRVASSRCYVYSVVFVWLAGISTGGMSLLAEYDILNLVHWTVALCAILTVSLTLICVSYLAIRTKLNCNRAPDIGAVHNNNQKVLNQSKKLSRTLFIMIGASLVFWFPSTVVYSTHLLCFRCVPRFLRQISTMSNVANSLVNPIIYSFRMPMFKETLKRMKLRKKSRQCRVD